MLLGGYLKLALGSIRSSKWRSLLTVLGIVIGVVSVVTTVSLGEGVKQQVVRQINHRGNDLITILPGRRIESSGGKSIFNNFSGRGTAIFGDMEYQTVKRNTLLNSVVPFGEVVGSPTNKEIEFTDARVIATNEDLPTILNQKIQYGTFFKDNGIYTKSAVIGKRVAEQLFGENVPLGKSFMVRGQEFIVSGVFEEFIDSLPFLPGNDYNSAIFISYHNGLELMGADMQVYQILAKPKEVGATEKAITQISTSLKKLRAGQEDYTILKQAESLALASDVLNLLTGFIAGIAAISLIVGGIGIMNIMLVSVTERTREIGVRKAVGATNRQILYQFLIEASLLSVFGGIIGVLLSIVTNIILRILTDLQPVITLPVVGLATGVSLSVGLIFGVMPAIKAAKKDPIDALRYE